MTSPSTNYLTNIIGNDPEIKSLVRNIAYFKNASDGLVDLIFNYGKIVPLMKGETAITEGEFDQWVYIILEGALDVFVGDNFVDRTSASLVGERCILGESRKASLKASNDGTILLGLDMAILDAMNAENSMSESNMKSLIELLAMIISVVYLRLAQVWVYQIGKQSLVDEFYSANLKVMLYRGLVMNEFSKHPEIKKHLDLFFRERFQEGKNFIDNEGEVDTSQLFTKLILRHKPDLISEMVNFLFNSIRLNKYAEFMEHNPPVEFLDFRSVLNDLMSLFLAEIGNDPNFEEYWHKTLDSINDMSSFPFNSFFIELNQKYSIPLFKIYPLVIKVLKKLTDYNVAFNQVTNKITQQYQSLDINDLRVNMNKPDPMLVSLAGSEFVSNYANLRKHLVEPYMIELEKRKTPATEKEPEDSDDSKDSSGKISQADIDQLLAQFK